MKFRYGWVALLILCVVVVGLRGDPDPTASACRAPVRTDPKPHRRAMVLGIDGLSGPAFHKRAFVDAAAPNLRALAESGRYSICESSDDERCALAHAGPNLDEAFEWRTASGWLSVITGVDSMQHRVASNDHMLAWVGTRDRYPSFFRILKERGLETAAVGVSTFLSSPILHPYGAFWLGSKPGIVDYENGTEAEAPLLDPSYIDYRYSTQKLFGMQDAKLSEWLVKTIECGAADVIMAVFDGVDNAGHDHGYGDQPGYLAAISEVDARFASILVSISVRVRSGDESWLVIVTSDHGGHTDPNGRGNHTRQPEDQRIPFIVAGIPPLALEPLRPPVTQMDVFPTLLAWFGVEPRSVDGRVQGLEAANFESARVSAPKALR